RRHAARHRPVWPGVCDACAGEHWQGSRMPSGLAPHTAAGIPAAGAGTTWRARLPVALVILTLVALLAVPIMVSRRGATLRREVAAIRGYVISGQRSHLERYREARAQEQRALAALRPLIERMDPAAGPELARLEALLVQWHAQQQEVAEARMTLREYAVLLPVQ